MKKFVIGVYVPDFLNKMHGGAYTYLEVLVDFLINVNNEEFDFKIITEGTSKHTRADQIIIDYTEIEYSFKQRLFLAYYSFWSFLKRKKKKRNYINGLRSNYILNEIKENKIDLLYYPNQHSALTDKYPFVINNWDLAHITVPPLPDTLKDLNVRQKWYSEIAVKALAIFAESEVGKNELVRFANIHEDRIKVLPIFPGKVIDLQVPKTEQDQILNRFKLSKDEYFFYPAQFWALKNHYNLLHAIGLLPFKNGSLKMVFCGADKGNLEYIKGIASELGILDRVVFLGFISKEELYVLYKNCLALIFPSLLGPTNMPILEAMELETPLLCSNLMGHKEMLPNYEGLFDPLDPVEMAGLFKRFIEEDTFRVKLKKQLMEIKSETKFKSESSLELLLDHFRELKKIRGLWK